MYASSSSNRPDEIRVSVEEELLGGEAARAHAFLLRPGPRLPSKYRGASRDRLTALGERVFEDSLKPGLRSEGVRRLRRAAADGRPVVLESRALEQVVRPLARYLAVEGFFAATPEFRDGRATGRILPPGGYHAVVPDGMRYAVFKDPSRGFSPPARLSVREALAGKHLLLVGVSGFIGKVWLASLLRDLPEIGRITVLLRPGREVSAQTRLRQVFDSPVFDVVRATAAGPDDPLEKRVEALSGDVTRSGLGLAEAQQRELYASVDVVVNCAGLTHFNPDLREALAVNVDGALNVLDFARRCRGAGLLHVSTSYVAGIRQGRIAEELRPFETPLGGTFDPAAEVRSLRRRLARLNGPAENGSGPASMRRAAIGAGTERAQQLGWSNTYTFTKALAEGLIVERRGEVPVAIVRPSIVEASREFPSPGWNEGVNASAPITYLLGTRIRQVPVNTHRLMDVVPVDAVARGLTLVTAALCEGRYPAVTQLGTSDCNPLTLGRAFELTDLAHEAHHRRGSNGSGLLSRWWRTQPVSPERYRRFSVPAQLRIVRAVNRLATRLGAKRPLARTERSLRRVRDLLELYEPFLRPDAPVFESTNIDLLNAALPDDERRPFAFEVRDLEWHDYWVHVQIPSQRKWTYPLLEGRQRPVGDSAPAAGGADDRQGPGATIGGVEAKEVEWQRS